MNFSAMSAHVPFSMNPTVLFWKNLSERFFQNKTVGFIENGTWALMAEKFMKKALESCKNLTYTESGVHIKSAMNENNIAEIEALADELCK